MYLVWLMFDSPRIIVWISDWQELIGALISGACTVVAGFIAYRSVLKQIRADNIRSKEVIDREAKNEEVRFHSLVMGSAPHFAELSRKLENYVLVLTANAEFAKRSGFEFESFSHIPLDANDFGEVKLLGVSATDKDWRAFFNKLSNELQTIHSRSDRYIRTNGASINTVTVIDDSEWYQYARQITLCNKAIFSLLDFCRGLSTATPAWPTGAVENGEIARPLWKLNCYEHVLQLAENMESKLYFQRD